MNSDLETEIVLIGDQRHLAVSGEIDLATAGDFEAACRALVASEQRLLLDFSGVTFIDSSCLAVLATMVGELGASNVMMRNPTEQVVHTLEITGLDHLLEPGAAPTREG